jgi:hypothetical protein
MTYLADMAMILATNDRRELVKDNKKNTASAFNCVREHWILWLDSNGPGDPTSQTLKRLTPPEMSWFSVLIKGLDLVGREVLAKVMGNPSANQIEKETEMKKLQHN